MNWIRTILDTVIVCIAFNGVVAFVWILEPKETVCLIFWTKLLQSEKRRAIRKPSLTAQARKTLFSLTAKKLCFFTVCAVYSVNIAFGGSNGQQTFKFRYLFFGGIKRRIISTVCFQSHISVHCEQFRFLQRNIIDL